MELAYLGLDRFDPPSERLDDQENEDEFCKSLLKNGGTWWPSEKRYMKLQIGDATEEPAEGEEKKSRSIGWIKRGRMWVVEYAAPKDRNIPVVADDSGLLHMCFTMEERCEMLKRLFWCPHLCSTRHPVYPLCVTDVKAMG